MISFVYILMVKIIVAQISGRHLFEHWKAAHNFHWQEKVKLFNTDAANAREQIKTLLVNFGLTVKELKKQLLTCQEKEALRLMPHICFFFSVVHRIVKTVLYLCY